MSERLAWTDLPELECALERLADYRREAEHLRLARPAASSPGSHGRQLTIRLQAVARWLDPLSDAPRLGQLVRRLSAGQSPCGGLSA